MTEIGIKQLKAHASEIVREVRERSSHYVVTYHGKPVGVLLPIAEAGSEVTSPVGEYGPSPWQELEELGEEIGRGWKADQTSAELLSEMRR